MNFDNSVIRFTSIRVTALEIAYYCVSRTKTVILPYVSYISQDISVPIFGVIFVTHGTSIISIVLHGSLFICYMLPEVLGWYGVLVLVIVCMIVFRKVFDALPFETASLNDIDFSASGARRNSHSFRKASTEHVSAGDICDLICQLINNRSIIRLFHHVKNIEYMDY